MRDAERRRRGLRGTPRGDAARAESAEHETPSGTHDVGSDGAAQAARGARRAAELERIGRLVVRTAICAEARNGRALRLHAAASALEDYLELVAAVEATARADAHAGHARRLRAAAATRASSCCASRPTRA